MKRLDPLDKLLFAINTIAGALLLFTYIIPLVNPVQYPHIAVFSLALPGLVITNVIFIIIWAVKLKLHILFSVIILAIGHNHTEALFSFYKKNTTTTGDLKIMSYNVRKFNQYEWIQYRLVENDIIDYINKQKVDILCMQEYSKPRAKKINLKYKFEQKDYRNGMAIYSNYKIINSGAFNFKNTINDILYADLKINNDTLRVYNLHLQSFGLRTDKSHFGNKTYLDLLHKFELVFIEQSKQVESLLAHIEQCKHKSIVMGDFNNTAFSWSYKQLLKHRKDAFIEAGKGFGKSYDHIFPFRIDFILPDEHMTVNKFDTHKIKLSDHYPITASINLNN